MTAFWDVAPFSPVLPTFQRCFLRHRVDQHIRNVGKLLPEQSATSQKTRQLSLQCSQQPVNGPFLNQSDPFKNLQPISLQSVLVSYSPICLCIPRGNLSSSWLERVVRPRYVILAYPLRTPSFDLFIVQLSSFLLLLFFQLQIFSSAAHVRSLTAYWSW
jgi:hypothetical protein